MKFYGLKISQYEESQNKAYHIFSEAKTQIVAPLLTRSSYNQEQEMRLVLIKLQC